MSWLPWQLGDVLEPSGDPPELHVWAFSSLAILARNAEFSAFRGAFSSLVILACNVEFLAWEPLHTTFEEKTEDEQHSRTRGSQTF